jgi:opacity protein-like surface antigen
MLFAFVVPLQAWAQQAPKAEFYGGYALIHETDLNMHGFLAGIEGKINDKLGIVGEFGLGTKGMSVFGVNVSLKAYTFLAGPRFGVRIEKVRFFGEALVGGLKFSGGTNVSGLDINVGTTAFTIAFGTGIDYSLNDKISIRPVQLDILASRASMLGETMWGNDIRYSAGVVFKFGQK